MMKYFTDTQTYTEQPQLIQDWLQMLKKLNIGIIDIAYINLNDKNKNFEDQKHQEAWDIERQKFSKEQSVQVSKIDQYFLLAYEFKTDKFCLEIALIMTNSIDEKIFDLVYLSLGWLFYKTLGFSINEKNRLEHFFENIITVSEQTDARIAIQEWVNNTAKYIKKEFEITSELNIHFFDLNKDRIQWVVSSDIYWTEKGSEEMQKLKNIALETVFKDDIYWKNDYITFPIRHNEKIISLIILNGQDLDNISLFKSVTKYLENNIAVIYPLIFFWRKTEQSLFAHLIHSSNKILKKLIGYGNYTWKALTILTLAVLLIIIFIPVDKLVKAELNVENNIVWTVTTPVQGYLKESLVRPGDKVTSGQLLAQLDDTDLRIQLAEQNSALEQAQYQFRAAMAEQDLTNSGLAVNQIETQKTKIVNINRKLQQMNLISPISGVVLDGDWLSEKGKPLEEGKPLFHISSQDQYKVTLHVADQDISKININQIGTLKLTSFPDQKFIFKIVRIYPIASVQNNINGFKVEAIWLSKPPAINSGMQGVGKIVVGKTNLLMRWTNEFINWLKLKIWSWW